MAVFFLRGDHSGLGGLGSHFAFEQFADRKPRARNLLRTQHGKEVGLVFPWVGTLENAGLSCRSQSDARVMPGANAIEPFAQSEIEEDAELYLTVAIDIRVRRDALGIALEQIIHHALTVILNEVDHAERDAEFFRHGACVGHVLLPRALAERIPLGHPVFHVGALDLVTLLAEQKRGYGAVHPARHGDENPGHDAISTRHAPQRRPL